MFMSSFSIVLGEWKKGIKKRTWLLLGMVEGKVYHSYEGEHGHVRKSGKGEGRARPRGQKDKKGPA